MTRNTAALSEVIARLNKRFVYVSRLLAVAVSSGTVGTYAPTALEQYGLQVAFLGGKLRELLIFGHVAIPVSQVVSNIQFMS